MPDKTLDPVEYSAPLELLLLRETRRALKPAFDQITLAATSATTAVEVAIALSLIQVAENEQLAALPAQHLNRVLRNVDRQFARTLARELRVPTRHVLQILKRGFTEQTLLSQAARMQRYYLERPATYAADIVAHLDEVDDPLQIRAMVKHRRNIAEDRLRIAAAEFTTQPASFFGRDRNVELGIEDFFWQSQRDDKVRNRHRELDGTRWAWTSPPTDQGLPGEPFGCRCLAKPVLETQARNNIQDLITMQRATPFPIPTPASQVPDYELGIRRRRRP